MIYDTLQNLGRYRGLSKNLDTAICFLQESGFIGLRAGRNEVDGDHVYINVMSLHTKFQEESSFEMHRRYADIHIDLVGTERILMAPPYNTLKEIQAYEEKDDCALYKGRAVADCTLGKGRFLLCTPLEAHMPNVTADDGPVPLYKCVVKVAWEDAQNGNRIP